MTSPVFQEPAKSDADEAAASDSQAAAKSEAEPAAEADATKVPSPEEWAKTLAALKKANREAESNRKRLKEIEDAKADEDKTETEKRAAADQRAQAAELRATRIEVAHEKGLTSAQAKRLVGSTKAEIEADADEILRDFPTTPTKAVAPKPDPSQGARGEAKTRPTSLAAAVTSHYAKP